MTTLTLGLTPALAREVARGADAAGRISHEEFGVRALQLLLRSMFGLRHGRPVGYRQSAFSPASRARQAKAQAARRLEVRARRHQRKQQKRKQGGSARG